MHRIYTPKKELYVGCALTHAPEEFRNKVESVKGALEENWNVTRFIGLVDGTEEDVYQQDIEQNVRSCDAFLAIADHPASGLGWELGVADERETPTLIVAKFGASVTRLLQGAAVRREHIVFHRYEAMEDIPALVEAYLRPMIK